MTDNTYIEGNNIIYVRPYNYGDNLEDDIRIIGRYKNGGKQENDED